MNAAVIEFLISLIFKSDSFRTDVLCFSVNCFTFLSMNANFWSHLISMETHTEGVFCLTNPEMINQLSSWLQVILLSSSGWILASLGKLHEVCFQEHTDLPISRHTETPS